MRILVLVFWFSSYKEHLLLATYFETILLKTFGEAFSSSFSISFTVQLSANLKQVTSFYFGIKVFDAK